MITYMDNQVQDISDAALAAAWRLEHIIYSRQFMPVSITMTAHMLLLSEDETRRVLDELTEHGYLRHMESEMKTSGLRFEQDNPDLQHYQLGDKVPGRNWGNTPKSHFE